MSPPPPPPPGPAFFRRYFRPDGHDAAWALIEGAFRSVANTAIVPLQDLLNLGGEARMNLPGRASGNWSWRFVPEQGIGHLAERLLDATLTYGRDPQLHAGKDREAGGHRRAGQKRRRRG